MPLPSYVGPLIRICVWFFIASICNDILINFLNPFKYDRKLKSLMAKPTQHSVIKQFVVLDAIFNFHRVLEWNFLANFKVLISLTFVLK